MMLRYVRRGAGLLLLALLTAGLDGPAAAQGILDSLGGGDDEGPVVTAGGVFATAADGRPARLFVTATMAADWHIYSITQAPGGPVRTQIKIGPSPDFQVGPFTAVQPPESHPEPAFDNLITETHAGSVTWVAALEIAPGVDPAKLEIKGNVFAQACANVCRPPTNYPFTAKLGSPPAAGAATPTLPLAAASAVGSSAPVGNGPSAGGSAGGGSSTAPPVPISSGPPVPPGAALAASQMPGLPAVLDGLPAPAAATSDRFAPNDKLSVTGRLEPATAAPGGKAKLHFTAAAAEHWHVYAVESPQASGNQATLLVVRETGGLQVGRPRADREPIAPSGEAASSGSRLIPYFEREVTWTLEVDVPADARPGPYRIAGVVGIQACDRDNSCLPPRAKRFEATLEVSAAPPADPAAHVRPVRFGEDERYATVAKEAGAAATGAATAMTPPTPGAGQAPTVAAAEGAATTGYDIAQIRAVSQQEESSSLPVMLGTGLLAGFILNFMPCVLPVIGLKVLSFVEQGGHDRRRVLMLNVWYSLGIVSVFLVLATIPVVLRTLYQTQFGWGQQFSYDGFNITLVAIVFVMALSFLGVWEIPIPGFAGSGGAQKAAGQEGAVGAFIKGMITTVLATPCSGPFLGTAVAFALRENAVVTYAMFTAMGLGMAAPYLAIGLRPSLVRLLPKPGEWMDTFKQVMGFVLVGTVLWLMLPIHPSNLMPTLVLLAGLAAGCWWIGRTPGYAELPEKLRAWAGASVFCGLVGWLAFAAPQVTDPLPWRHFTMREFADELNSGKTVLVEFTADWCATCKALKAANLDRSKTKSRIEKNGVVVFEVNVDETTPEERRFFEKLQPSGAVPLVVIFGADKKYEPIRFGDGYTQSQILDALDTAGPSKRGGAVARK